MALNAATLNAIQKAQLGFEQGVQAGSGFSQAFDTAYKTKVEKLAKRAEQEEEYRLASMDLIDQYEAENEKLGIFSSVATENILKPAKNKLFDVTNIQSKVDQELMEREVGKEMSSKMKPLADANLYLQGLIKSNADVNFSNSLSDELIELNGKQYNKKDFLQALGTNHTAKDLNTISFKLGDETIDLPINKLKEEQFKYSNINTETLADHDTAMNRFTTSARQSNFTGMQVDNMVNQFLINQPDSVKRDLAYNYYQKDEDDKNKDVETFLKERMKSKIQSGYAYKQPEVEEEEEETETDTPYFTAQKSMLDKILSTNKLGENMYRLGESPGISYYKSNEFKKMLPPQLTYVKEGDVVQIQDKKNTNINHIIDPELSLEYNINQLEALLRSKKP
jgi:DNA-binding transcriptional regulator GbsR (MarR family)